MDAYALRLIKGQDIRAELDNYAVLKQINAGFILTCVGSLESAVLRFADEQVRELQGPYEIVSLVGTLCPDGSHLHISIADKYGQTYGGHVKKGCIVYTTAEVVIGEEKSLRFSRKPDNLTGFDELVIE